MSPETQWHARIPHPHCRHLPRHILHILPQGGGFASITNEKQQLNENYISFLKEVPRFMLMPECF